MVDKEILYKYFILDADKFLFTHPTDKYMESIETLKETMKWLMSEHNLTEKDIYEFIEKYYKELLEMAEINKNRLYAVFEQRNKEK